ncbi:hypothetical protein HK098_001494 [Nowakowskiella sp. JEL0407]|nr:hypothetical protein HK098_001494 [Nowakowskiella sp. JEL0407]
MINVEGTNLDIEEKGDLKLRRQYLEIEECFDYIHKLENELLKIGQKIEEITILQSTSFIEQMEQENKAMRDLLLKKTEENQAYIAKLLNKHQAAINATDKRVDHFIIDLENVACKREVDKITPETRALFESNTELKKKVEKFRKELIATEEMVDSLEEENIRLICESIEVDWNFLYDDGLEIELEESFVEEDDFNFDDDFYTIKADSLHFKTKTEEILNRTAKEIIRSELMLTEKMNKVSVKGKAIKLEKLDVNTAGGMKFYSEIVH